MISIYIYIYIYINVTPLNNLLLNSYFENPTIELYVLSIVIYHLIHKLIFYALFQTTKLEFKQLIDGW